MTWYRAGSLGSCLILCSIAAQGCRATPPSGIFPCASDNDCPPHFVCEPSDGLCYSELQQPGPRLGDDATTGVGVDGAPADVSSTEGGVPPGSPDAGVAQDSSAAPDSGASRPEDPAPIDEPKQPIVLPMEPDFMPHEPVQLPRGQSLVSGGVRSKSSNYSAVRSLGQSPASGYPVRRSKSYVLVGGVVGVTHALR
jgi:hypothetical protein